LKQYNLNKSFPTRFLQGLFMLFFIASTAVANNSQDSSTRFSLAIKQVKALGYLEKANAIIYLPKLRWGSLFQLRGGFGRAALSIRDQNKWCGTAPVRVLLGDFNGMKTNTSNKPDVILILIMNAEITKKLTLGIDITGDDYSTSSFSLSGRNTDTDLIMVGMDDYDSGLILNPGSSFLNDLFGTQYENLPCDKDSSQLPFLNSL